MLQPVKDHLRALYLRSEDEQPETGTSAFPDASAPATGNILIDLESFSTAGDDEAPGQSMDAAARFCRATLRDWIAQLKHLPEEPQRLHYLGLERSVLEDLLDELLTGADRLGLETRLAELIRAAEEQAAAKRAQLAERQVYAVHAGLSRYVDYLGQADVATDERPPSKTDRLRPLFAPNPVIPENSLPTLAPRPVNFSGLFILDWFEALRHLILDNAGHSAGRDITPEQNARLGEVLAVIEGREDRGERG
jgi:hypothetical protein